MSTEILSLCFEHCRILRENYKKFSPNGMSYFDVEEGRKYIKIVQINSPGKSVHCFVDKTTGDLYKAASWAAPAKGVRFNLLKDMEVLRNCADWAGGYLYKR